MRTHKPVSVSLTPEMLDAADKRAASLGFKRATYIQQLILADLKKQKVEETAQAAPTQRPTSKKRGAKRP